MTELPTKLLPFPWIFASRKLVRRMVERIESLNRDISVLAAENARLLQDTVVTQADQDVLLAVATLYVDAFRADEMMTLPEKLRLRDVEAIVERYGRRS